VNKTKIFITDSGSGLTKESAARMGLIYISHNILYKGEPIEDVKKFSTNTRTTN